MLFVILWMIYNIIHNKNHENSIITILFICSIIIKSIW